MKLIITIVFAFVALAACTPVSPDGLGRTNESQGTQSEAVKELQQRISMLESKLTRAHRDVSLTLNRLNSNLGQGSNIEEDQQQKQPEYTGFR